MIETERLIGVAKKLTNLVSKLTKEPYKLTRVVNKLSDEPNKLKRALNKLKNEPHKLKNALNKLTVQLIKCQIVLPMCKLGLPVRAYGAI